MAKTSPAIGSGAWVEERYNNVLDQVEGYVDGILDGLLSEGYGLLEKPLTDADIRRMSPEDLEAYSAGLDDAQKAELMGRLAKLEVPWYLAAKGEK